MKVKELIEELKKLDQDKGIWVWYDGGYGIFTPEPDRTLEADDVSIHKKDHPDLEIGDYVIDAW